MSWKEILIGAAISLIVTVLGGLLVYYFTYYKSEPKSEILSYQIDKQVSFVGSDKQVSIGSLKFANIGAEPAKNVSAIFHISNSSILEFKVTSESEAEISKELSKDKKSLSLSIKHLLPDEIISVTYLLSKESPVEFQLRSEKSIGKAGFFLKTDKSRNSLLNDFIGNLVPLLILFVIPLLFIIRKLLRASNTLGNCKNNVGFVLLHKKSIDDALSILTKSVNEGKDGAYSLANYASALALTGDLEKAERYIEAAKFLARNKYEKAVCEFNNAIIEHELGNKEKSIDCLRESLSLSKKEINNYLEHSHIFKKMLTENNDLRDLIAP